MLALLALAFVLGAGLARRMVPEPWATYGAGLAGLSPPALAASTTVTPGVPAAVLLAGAAPWAVFGGGHPPPRHRALRPPRPGGPARAGGAVPAAGAGGAG